MGRLIDWGSDWHDGHAVKHVHVAYSLFAALRCRAYAEGAS